MVIHKDLASLLERVVTSAKAEGLRECTTILSHYCEKSGINAQQVKEVFDFSKEKADEILKKYCSKECRSEVVDLLNSILGQREVFKLLGYMYGMANTTASMYVSWEADFIKETLFKNVSKLKSEFESEEIDYTKLTQEDLRLLGFRPWDEKQDMLIPMWLFRLLPDDTKLYCPLTEDSETVLRKDADDDYRFGCSAYALMETKRDVEQV